MRHLMTMFGLKTRVYWLASLFSDMTAYSILGLAAIIVGEEQNAIIIFCFVFFFFGLT